MRINRRFPRETALERARHGEPLRVEGNANTDYDDLTFFFEDRNDSSATSPPNSLVGDVSSQASSS